MMRAALGRPPCPPPPARAPPSPPGALKPAKTRAARARGPRPTSSILHALRALAALAVSGRRAPARLVRGGRMGSAAAAGSDLWKLAAIPVCTRHLDM